MRLRTAVISPLLAIGGCMSAGAAPSPLHTRAAFPSVPVYASYAPVQLQGYLNQYEAVELTCIHRQEILGGYFVHVSSTARVLDGYTSVRKTGTLQLNFQVTWDQLSKLPVCPR